MKNFLTVIIFLNSISKSSAQWCDGGIPIGCSNEKIVSPAVTKPTGVSLLSATCSTLVIRWTGTTAHEYGIKATYTNTQTNATDTITVSSYTCDAANNCIATLPVQPGIKYTWSVESRTMINGCPYYSYPETKQMEYPVTSCNGTGVQFSGKVFLQGAYNTATGLMNNDLNTLGILQAHAKAHPYNNNAFFYTGTENIADDFYATRPDIVDWVLLELRDPNASSSVVARRAAFVKQDGTIVDTNGINSQINFPNLASGNYFVSVRHRNHLGILTSTPVDFTTGAAIHDFTTSSHSSFKNQSYSSTVQTGTVWAMRGGNANANGSTRYSGPGSDQNQILNMKLSGSLSLVLNNVYAAEDVNMNGNIKWSGPGSDQNFLLNVVLAGSLSAILNEQY